MPPLPRIRVISNRSTECGTSDIMGTRLHSTMVAYTISWTDPHERLFDLSISFTAPSDEPRLLLPVWRPGRYVIQNYAANVRQWSAAALGGDSLDLWKDGK